MPKLKSSVKEGRVSSEWSRAFIKGIEMAEVGDALKSALAKGEMTEDEAWKKWEKLYGDESEISDKD